MQISKISSTPSFGCQKCANQIKKQCPEYTQTQATKAVTVTRNALIAGLVGLLTNCTSNNDTYTLTTTPEGLPLILNQDGDSIDFLPKSIRKEYRERFGTESGAIPVSGFKK